MRARSLLLSAPALLLAPAALAEEPAPPKPFEIGGVYAIWGLQQHNFLLGNPDNPLDDADYVVQMLRLNARFDKERYGVVARLDAAQGWWGVDNSPDVATVPAVGEDGSVSTGTAYNPYKLFGDKDTNYAIHVDHAYAWVEVPGLPVRVQAGRQYLAVGHGLVLDIDGDGVVVQVDAAETVKGRAFWAKMSEGQGSVVAPTGLLMADSDALADADLLGADLALGGEAAKLGLYGLWYSDRSGGDLATYLPQGLGYLGARYRPNLSRVLAAGLTLDGTLAVGEGLRYAVEGSYLTGTDAVDNADTAGGLLDVNDGELSGWNAYASLDQRLDLGVPVELGGLVGAGSGDEDVTGGPGNINKIQTFGLWGLTNVWEDSVMPDIGGISPQGLGSPVSRGYRELQNTTAAQARIKVEPHEQVSLKASYTFLRATTPIHGFDATGAPTAASSQDIGQEVDLDLGVQVWKGFRYVAQGGVFLPGEGAALLINGAATNLEPAWEIKHVVSAAF